MPLDKKDRAKQDTREIEAPEDGETASVSKPPKTRRRLLWLLWLLILIPLVYIIIQVVIILMPRMRTQVAIQDVMTDALSVEGYVTLESVPVYGGGVLYYTVPTGQRVSAGGEVALVFGSEAEAEAMAQLQNVTKELALLTDAQQTFSEGGDVDVYLRQMEDGLMEYLDALETGDYLALESPREEIALAANRIQVVTGNETDFNARIAYLNEEKARLEALAAPSGTITAPETGYFVPSGGQDRIPKSYEELTALAPTQLQQAMQEPPAYYDSSVSGHIVTDYHWRFFTVVTAEEAEKFSVGAKLEISFPEASEEVMPVTVEQVEMDEQAGIAKIELLCENIGPDILRLRMEKAEIIFDTQKGLRIENGALRVIEGETCVYVKFGNQVYLRRV
ncbi:hypothetical protein LJC49_10720, partial [Ruminococcaceae bacterium OttesenSCG-928-I18]|nr:hypothetical protein [Ruminococcaceae bacterium OttesenSCG-928-I18]